MKQLYKIFITVFFAGIRIVSTWNKKAKRWIYERKDWEKHLTDTFNIKEKRIWIHCASAGEFEQAKPLIEGVKFRMPDYKIFVSFFSPSGFDAANNYKLIDAICYLPLDTAKNASSFLDITQPDIAIFIKYEFWYNFLSELKKRKIPVILVSAIFYNKQVFFKKWAPFFKNILYLFEYIFVQDAQSLDLLIKNNILHCSISGDTRFDRVLQIAENANDIPILQNFINEQPVLVAGSTWPEDESLLSSLVKNQKFKLIVAPHEVNEEHIRDIEKKFKGSVRYSLLSLSNRNADVLIIDNIGMLSRIYKYATIAYIGGGLSKSGIHNTLEAAVYKIPLIFGPVYKKYKEAVDLVEIKGAYTFNYSNECNELIQSLFLNKEIQKISGEIAGEYVRNHAGATKIILDYLQAKRLLTN